MADTPNYTAFVSSVEGRLVPRWGTGFFIGAHLRTPDEVSAGQDAIVWEPDVVVPLTDSYCRTFARELEQALEMGDLRKRSKEEFDDQDAERAKRRAERAKQRKADAAKAESASLTGEQEPVPAERSAKAAKEKSQ